MQDTSQKTVFRAPFNGSLFLRSLGLFPTHISTPEIQPLQFINNHVWAHHNHFPIYATRTTTEANAQGRIPNTNINVQVITYQSNALLGSILEYEKFAIPIRLHQFEHELSSHLHKTFVAYMLSGIQYSFDIGYNGLQFAHTAPNLASAFIDPSIIDIDQN